ncbi:YbaN family protein [uncultured Xylophilus sp.]|uniref:YbaN family protein n=1 Tax=uncultured Xylophilus sp. TaxID=296832 RepID=UPI0025F8E074|nr:YbaN family protein [uncultured Xylophilus sp.]
MPTLPAAPSSPRLLPAPLRWLMAVLAAVCIALGVVGIFVPGMPTTVFIIVAAWAAARGSPRLHGWLLRHRWFGPLLRNWEDGGRMSRRAKWSATAAMAACALLVLATMHRPWTASLALACMDGVLAWLWCRPEPRDDSAA